MKSNDRPTLTEAEHDAILDALIDDQNRAEGYVVIGPGGTDGNTPTVYEAVETILRARLAATEIKLAAARLALAACREVREARES